MAARFNRGPARWLPIFAASALPLVPAQAFVNSFTTTELPQKWNLVDPPSVVNPNVVNPATRAVRYFLSADAYSSANRTAELNAARACFDQWQAVPGSILRFEEGGLMSGALDVNTADNTNVVFWARNSTIVNGGLDNITGTTGLTFSDYFSDGTLAEADIVLNGVQFSWFTDYSNAITQAQFVESVLLHEIGHLIGLSHSPVGGATMFPRGGAGVSVQAGLSADEFSAVHSLYPASGIPGTLGTISGAVTKSGQGVYGAIVTAQNAFGNVIAGTVTRPSGAYQMPGLPPGDYQVHVSPLDATSVNYPLLRGPDIANGFGSGDTAFRSSPNSTAHVEAGGSTRLDFSVAPGTPSFRVARLWPPTTDPTFFVAVNYAVAAGRDRDVTVGVYSPEALNGSARLKVTGAGLTLGESSYAVNPLGANLNAVSLPIHIAADAPPGLRTLVLEYNGEVAYLNGFLDLLPAFPDDNFDGLDDRFQRQYFARWTAAESAPGADPDSDGFSNSAEFTAGSNPLDTQSVLKVESVRWDANGATVTWPSAPGRKYQVLSRSRVDGIRGWQPLGAPVVASGNRSQFLDRGATGASQFYRVQAVP